MNPLPRLLVLLLTFALVPAPARSDEAPARAYRGFPWHLVDYWWDFGEARDFESYSLDVTIEGKIDPEIPLYIAPVGIGDFGGQRFYGGLQTQSDGYREFPHPKQKEFIGKGVIFSRWDVRGLGASRRATGGLFESGGYEGDFISVRNTFDWSAGSYTYSLRKMDKEVVDGATHTWVGGFVRDHAAGTERYIGALRFRGNDLKLSARLASFVEIYRRPIPLDQIPDITVTFSNWRINGEAVTPEVASAFYADGVPPYLASEVEGGAVKATIGERDESRPDGKRHRQVLWGKK